MRAISWISEPSEDRTDVPSLPVFAPDRAKANGVGVIVCPGGAWRVLAWEHEGINPARWLTACGYTALLLKYRGLGTPPDPAEFSEAVSKMAASMPSTIPGAKAPRALADAMPDPSVARAREIAAAAGRRWGGDRPRAGRRMGRQAGPDRYDRLFRRRLLDYRRRLGAARRAAGLRRADLWRRDPGPCRAGRRTTTVHGGRTGRSDVFPSGRGPLCRLVQRRSPGRAAHLHPWRSRFWRRQARLTGGSVDRSARGLAGGSGGGRLAGFCRVRIGAELRHLNGVGTRPATSYPNAAAWLPAPHADMGLPRRIQRIHLTNVQRAKMSWLSWISWSGSGLRPRRPRRSA